MHVYMRKILNFYDEKCAQEGCPHMISMTTTHDGQFMITQTLWYLYQNIFAKYSISIIKFSQEDYPQTIPTYNRQFMITWAL